MEMIGEIYAMAQRLESMVANLTELVERQNVRLLSLIT